tara:strand:+ start:262 stop:1038 length:777 start_codon:yes stop_codon:yes gene_type:complete
MSIICTVNLNDFKDAVEAIWLKGKYKSSTTSKVDVVSNTAVGILSKTSMQLLNGNDKCGISVSLDGLRTNVNEDTLFIFDIEKANKYLKNLKSENIDIKITDANILIQTTETSVRLPKLVEHPNMALISRIRDFDLGEDGKPVMFGKTPLPCKLFVEGKDLATAIKYCNLVGTASFKIDATFGKDTLKVSSENFHQTEMVDRTITMLAPATADLTVAFSAPIDKFCTDGPMYIYSDDDKPIILWGNNRKMVIAPYLQR